MVAELKPAVCLRLLSSVDDCRACVELQRDGVPVSVTQIMPGTINTPLFDYARTKMGVKPEVVGPRRVDGCLSSALATFRRRSNGRINLVPDFFELEKPGPHAHMQKG